MFAGLSNADISVAISEMMLAVGVKEEMPFADLVTLLRKKDIEGCIQEIARRLRLPVRIDLSYVSADFKPGDEARFQTGALVHTDAAGHGIEGITAQVVLPPYLPIFGSADLQGYPVRVRVSENCTVHPETFVAVMAHELSHVLLASLWHQKRSSEVHVDLVPMLMGFRGVVSLGRKSFKVSKSGNTTTTRTTTYGYLTDAQFDFACTRVSDILARHRGEKNLLMDIASRTRLEVNNTLRSLAAYRDYFRYLDRRPPKKMSQEHAQKIVELHARDYDVESESRIAAISEKVAAAERFAGSLNH